MGVEKSNFFDCTMENHEKIFSAIFFSRKFLKKMRGPWAGVRVKVEGSVGGRVRAPVRARLIGVGARD